MLETLNMATWHKIRKRPFLKISFLVFLKLGHISAANPFHVTDLFLDPPENIRKPLVFWCLKGI